MRREYLFPCVSAVNFDIQRNKEGLRWQELVNRNHGFLAAVKGARISGDSANERDRIDVVVFATATA
jgi:hypothetical protein